MTKCVNNRTYIDGERLSKLRKSKGLSQQALADKANLSKRSIEGYERKKAAGIQPQNAKQLAEVLDVPLDSLLVNKIDVIETELPVVLVAEDLDNTNVQNSVDASRPLHLNCHADSILRSACNGLLATNDSDNCVSSAIAQISGYLYHLVAKIPKLKEHSHLIISNSIPALSCALLEESCATNIEMWSGYKNGMSELANVAQLPNYAKKEALDIVSMIAHSRMTNDMELKFNAIRLSLFWLSDNWQYIYQNSYAYSVFRYVSCMLNAAPNDYRTRENIIIGVNAFVSFIKLYDSNGIYYQKGDTNE